MYKIKLIEPHRVQISAAREVDRLQLALAILGAMATIGADAVVVIKNENIAT